MAERKPVVLVSGQLKELPAGDTLPPQTPATHSHATSDVTGLDAALSGKQPTISAGTTAQYWRGDKTWRDFFTDVRAATLTGLSTATNAVIDAADTVLVALGKLQAQITGHTGSTANPHSVTKSQVGLGNVDNTSDANKPVSTAQQTALNMKADLAGAAFTGASSVTVNSASAALTVTQTGSGHALLVEDSASPDSTPFVIDSEGRVGQATIDARAMHNIGQHAATGSGLQYYRAGGAYPVTGTAYAIPFHSEVTTPASATVFSELTSFKSQPPTTGANSTITLLQGFAAVGPPLGAGASIGTQIGFAASSSLTAATNNYGFYGNIPAGTGRYNFYAAGTADNVFNGNVKVINGSAALGYGAGAGGTATQTGSRTSGVILNKPSGQITLVSAAGTTAWQSFTVTNSVVESTDTPIVAQVSGTDLYEIHVTAVATGSFRLSFRTTGGTTTEQPVFKFEIHRGATA